MFQVLLWLEGVYRLVYETVRLRACRGLEIYDFRGVWG